MKETPLILWRKSYSSVMIGKIFVSANIPKCPEHYMSITVLF